MIICLFLAGLHRSDAAFQTAIITLVFPSGARECGMGEVGTALADDENVLYWNPAGLGVRNERWTYAAGTSFWELLLPELRLQDLWHAHGSGVSQAFFDHIGGFGADVNYLNFGTNEYADEEGRLIHTFTSWEGVAALGWGFNFEDIGIENHSWGITLKGVQSALAPGIGPGDQGTARTFAVDIGYLFRFCQFWRFGFTFMNMGPPVFYISEDEKDPIPFTANLAVAFKRSFIIQNLRILDFCGEFRFSREIAKNYDNGRPDPFWRALFTDVGKKSAHDNLLEAMYNFGGELTIFNTASFRQGFLFDYTGQRYELHNGIGVKFLNHYQLDAYIIYSPEGYFANALKPYVGANDDHRHGSWGVRHRQFGFSFSFFGIGKMNSSDQQWWEVKPE
jgi:hypothetical protein